MTTDTATNTLAETALYYAKNGWQVFPLKPRDKTPLTPNGLHDATTDPDTIRDWWERWADANIGLNAGLSVLLVLDFDTAKADFAGAELLDKLRAEHPTTTAQTGSGGFHLLYQQPANNPLGNSRGRLPTGVDVRGVGGYIVVAPSIHPNGNAYKWVVYPAQMPPQPLPDVVLDLLRKQDRPAPTATPQATHTNGNGLYTFDDDLQAARRNLARLRPGRADDRDAWIGVGMALSQLGAAGLPLWDDWSQQSAKYKPGECAQKWAGFTPGKGYTLASLAHWAKEDDPSGAALPVDSEAVKVAQAAVGVGASMHTNGSGPGASSGTPGASGGPQAGPVDPLADLLSELAAVEDDTTAVMAWALDNVAALAGLSDADFAKLCLELKARGVTTRWLTSDLRRAVDSERDDKTNGPVWTDYVNAAAKLGYRFRLNVLGDTLEVNGQRMTDVHEAVLLSKLHAQGLKNAEVARRAFLAEADRRHFHPVKEYLEGLKWDGQDHITALSGYFTDTHDPITYADGTQRTAFHAFLRRWLVGAVAKVYSPTDAQNPMLILDGEQGKGKSYFAKWICPLPELHFEGAIRPEDKDYLRYLTSCWVWEVGELGATMRKADREALKEFITKQDATFRPAFGRHPLVKPALASFIGTVNLDGALLSDPTGHRRFWPVELTRLDWGYNRTVDANQLWAQAYALYRAGESWQLTPEERDAHAAIVELYEVEDVLAGYIQESFVVNPNNPALYTHTTEIVDTLRNAAQLRGSDRAVAMQIASSLTRLGLSKAKRNNRWGYVGIAPVKPIP